MSLGRKEMKNVVARDQNGLSNSGASQQNTIATPTGYTVSTPGNLSYDGEVESQKVLTGPGAGVGSTGGASALKGDKWGHVGVSGSAIMLDDTAGGETLRLQHHTGAHVTIDPDGSVFVISNSRKGVGVSAPFGDAFIGASGDIVIQGAGVNIKSTGDVAWDVAGTLSIKANAIQIITNTLDQTVDGSASYSVTNDQSLVVGGFKRDTVAGSSREQVTGKKTVDVGDTHWLRVGGNHHQDVQGTSEERTNGNLSVSTQGEAKLAAAKNNTISGEQMRVTGDETIISGETTKMIGSGAVRVSGASVVVDSSGGTEIIGSSAVTVASGGVARLMGASSEIHGAEITLASERNIGRDLQGSASPQTPDTKTALGKESRLSSQDANKAAVLPAPDIVDELTSVRKYPQYPRNAKRESGSSGAQSTVEHDSMPQAEEAYKEYSSKNAGNLNATQSESFGEIPENSKDEQNNGKRAEAVESTYSVPARHNNSTKISRYFTLGDLVHANSSHTIPADKWESVVANHIKVAYNVLDPIKEKFPDVLVTSAYRPNSKNHITGLAIDLVVNSRDMAQHAEIARFARDNLPCDQVFLEKNDQGRSHVHVRFGSGTPKCLTCGDAKCASRVPGINLEYLKRVGTR